MEPIEIRVPRDLMELLGLENQKSLEKHSRMLLATELYLDEKVSMGKAAELAGTHYDEFYAFIKERGHKLRIGPKTPEEAERDYKAAKRRLQD